MQAISRRLERFEQKACYKQQLAEPASVVDTWKKQNTTWASA
jgi:hypothetical protein